MIELKKKRSSERERCVLVAIVNKQQDEEKALEYLEELRFLADTAGADTVHMFTQKLSQPNSKTFLGTGKMEEILGYVKAEGVDMVVFDDELTPSQLKNIEAMMEVKVIKLGQKSATSEGRIFNQENKLVATLLHTAQPVDVK